MRVTPKKLSHTGRPRASTPVVLGGEQLTGHEALQQDFTALFEEMKEARLEVSVESVDFISPNVALEQGTASLMRPDSPPEKSSYSVVHVKRDGKWLIDRVTDEEIAAAPVSHYKHLKGPGMDDWRVGRSRRVTTSSRRNARGRATAIT